MIDVQVEVAEPAAGGAAGAGPTPDDARTWVAAARAAVEATLADRDVEVAEISLALLDDAAIRALNLEHLGHDRATDVISFALYGEDEPVLGDVYVGWEQAVRQAAEVGVPLLEELTRLAVHGTLHVLGWDHPDPAAARSDSEMYRLQEAIVAAVVTPSGDPV